MVSVDSVSHGFKLAVGDLDLDGKPDLVGSAFVDGTVNVALNSTPAGASSPSFAPRFHVPMADAGFVVDSIQIVDINGDGKPDLVATANNAALASGTLSVAINTSSAGSTTFAPATRVATGRNIRFVASDLNADGLPEIVLYRYVDGNQLILTNTTSIGSPTPTFSPAPVQFFYFPAIVQDVDRDNSPDLLIPGIAPTAVEVQINFTPRGGAPVFGSAQAIGSSPAGRSPCGLYAMTDLNGDGRSDFLVQECPSSGNTGLALLLSKPP